MQNPSVDVDAEVRVAGVEALKHGRQSDRSAPIDESPPGRSVRRP
jgi:hypothetical protein